MYRRCVEARTTLGCDCRTFIPYTYILESLEAAPPVTLATRSWDNSFLRSSSCLSSSSFFLPRRSRALILAWRMSKHSKLVIAPHEHHRRHVRASPPPGSRPTGQHAPYWKHLIRLIQHRERLIKVLKCHRLSKQRVNLEKITKRTSC